MVRALDWALIERLDRLVQRTGIHAGPLDLPVDPSPLLEAFSRGYGPLPAKVVAVGTWWESDGERYRDILYNGDLVEPERSALRRYASVHEFAHYFCKHRGDLFVLWQSESYGSFERYVEDWQESQARAVSAYILVRREALRAFRGEPSSYISRVLDVPVELVEVRWGVWRRFGR